ncbi:MAG: NUDIX hydrolase [Ardenticatenaceae bacterium]|nr:NUDIX hydrolase [Ardenticatenaceae bacterium]
MSPYQTTSSQIVWSCPWYRVRQDRIITPDGRPGVYNVVMARPAAWVIPVTDQGEIVLIYTYRYAIDAWCWEVVAGGLQEGKTVWETAVTELREEIGGVARDWHFLGRFYTANGFSNEEGHYYLATGVTLSEPTAHESTEVLEIHPLPIAEVLRMARAGEITDSPSVTALLLAEPRLREMIAHPE